MSLLPSAFQDREPTMQLGAKVTKPEPVKVDPVREFEKGDHGFVKFTGVDATLEELRSEPGSLWAEWNPEASRHLKQPLRISGAVEALFREQFVKGWEEKMFRYLGVPTEFTGFKPQEPAFPPLFADLSFLNGASTWDEIPAELRKE